MVEAERAVEKGAVEIGLGRVAGVVGLGGEADVGQTDAPGQGGGLPEVRFEGRPPMRGVDEEQSGQEKVGAKIEQVGG